MDIYSECVPSAGGGTHHTDGGHHKTTSKSQSSGSTAPVASNPTPTVAMKPVKVSQKVHKSLLHAGHDRKMLTKLVTDPWLGATQAVEASDTFRAKTPSALGSVFDLGSGPTALFAMLLAVAIVLLGVGGFRARRQR